MKELVDEIVRLSTKYGILTEYTAFLATEERARWGAPGDEVLLHAEVDRNLRDRAMATPSAPGGASSGRAGGGAVAQEQNLKKQFEGKSVSAAKPQYFTYDQDAVKEVEISTVQNVADRTFFQRKNRWIDSNLLKFENEKPDRTVEFGTPENMKLAEELAKDNRQVALALGGDVLIQVGKERVLVKAP
jgi:Ca-activated chloride channel family protein